MKKYYVNENAQPNGDHEVHNDECPYFPLIEKHKYLGEFWNCTTAIQEAKKHYPTADGCKTCSEPCHTR